ncbi:MAG: cellulase family glycosylhydrolase [Acidimicrobiia bacterium]
MTRRRTLRSLSIAVALGVVTGLPMIGGPARAVGTAELGVVSDVTWGISRADIDRSVASMQDAGVRWARVGVSWNGGEPYAKGSLNHGWLTEIDYAVNKVRSAGIQVLMPIDGVPYWASADPAKYTDGSGQHWNVYWRPTNWQDYADFVRQMVLRYKALGVRAYQIWNEPNHSHFWPQGISAVEYAGVLSRAHNAVKLADPTATVVMGGLSMSDWAYLERLYASGARGTFDVAAVHPYTGAVDPTLCWTQAGTTRKAREAFCGIEEINRTMTAYGDGTKAVWLTEFGWTTSTGEWGVSELTQADFLNKAVTKLQTYPYVKVALWYSHRNLYWSYDNPGDWQANYGLLRTNFSQKPAYSIFKTLAGGPLPAPTTTTSTSTTTTTKPAAQGPVISSVRAESVLVNSARIRWTTNVAATSRVDYWVTGTTAVLSRTAAAYVTSHDVALTGLSARTKYSYRVTSVDSSGRSSTSATYTFTTPKR